MQKIASKELATKELEMQEIEKTRSVNLESNKQGTYMI